MTTDAGHADGWREDKRAPATFRAPTAACNSVCGATHDVVHAYLDRCVARLGATYQDRDVRGLDKRLKSRGVLAGFYKQTESRSCSDG